MDQHGAPFSLARLRGRVVLVTFAYGHCETVCPLVVADVLAARRMLGDLHPAPAAVIVTLDPWRDTPPRLPALATRWGLEGDAFALGGSVSAVDSALARWGVRGPRDERTGEITHAPVVFVVDRTGPSRSRPRGPGAPTRSRRSCAGSEPRPRAGGLDGAGHCGMVRRRRVPPRHPCARPPFVGASACAA